MVSKIGESSIIAHLRITLNSTLKEFSISDLLIKSQTNFLFPECFKTK